MKNFLLICLCFIALFLEWCYNHNIIDEDDIVTLQYSETFEYSGDLICKSADEELDYIKDLNELPKCDELDVDKNRDIISIDDIVTNCSYKTNDIRYSEIWWGGWLLPQIYIMEDDYVMPSIFSEEKFQNICKLWDEIMINVQERYIPFVEFLDKHNMKEKKLISIALPRLESVQGSSFYFSGRDSFITWNEYWESWNNYYLYGSFYPIEGSDIYLVFNDEVFYAWKIDILPVGDYEIMSDWRRNVIDFVWNSLKITKMDSIQLNFDTNIDTIIFEHNGVIWTYTTKTCILNI